MPLKTVAPPANRQRGAPLLRWELSDRTVAGLFVLPAVLFITVFAIGPIAGAAWLSLHRHLPIFQLYDFVGLQNFLRVWTDNRFWSAVGTTAYFTVLSVTAEVALGLMIALLLRGPLSIPEESGRGPEMSRASNWISVVILLPWIIPTVVSARMWEWLYHPEFGLLNHLLLSARLIRHPINWLGDPIWALHGAILMDVWKATPFAAILLLAGLRTIPPELYLAARVDGAGAWTTFRHVTLPLLLPVVLIVATFRTMDAFRVFDAVFVLTGGGPGNSTETLSIYAYKTLFQTLQFGYGSALACMMFVLILTITSVYLMLLRRRMELT
jgi:multiple sugar transport system permease protein